MKVLVIGKGGREHALVHAVSRSGRVKKIYAAPGNPGMAELAECVNIADSDVKGLTAFAKEQEIDLTIVGPEATLSLGIVDAFQAEGLKIFGPTRMRHRWSPARTLRRKSWRSMVFRQQATRPLTIKRMQSAMWSIRACRLS